MKRIFILFFLFSVSLLSAQTIPELEKQLKEASSSREKMVLNKKLGEAYLKVDTKKALSYAKKAHDLANQKKNHGMAGSSAYLVAQIYERKRDERNQEVWLRSAEKYGKQAKDSDLIIKSVVKRAKLATSDRNYRKAYQIYESAFNYFSQKGTSMSELESAFEMQKAQIEKEKRNLEREKEGLLSEVNNLSEERDQLSKDKSSLVANQKQLVKQNQEAADAITEKEEKLKSVSKEKEEATKLAKEKAEEYEKLSHEALAQEAALEETRANLAEAELAQQRSENLRNMSIGGAAFVVVLALFFFSLYRSSRKAKRNIEEKSKIIEQERERSDELLLNILPSDIATELKEFGKAKARKFDEVTVLFSDFKNFTRISELLSPEELVEELDKCFKAFDFIISQYPDIEKIKTIGDAYMCASGLSERKGIPANLIKASLEMQEFLEEQKQERIRLGKPFFESRIGIHTGPVVAGVVGVNKFAYDIWGDTVNIAARMEANCEVGRVNISETTHTLVKYDFPCEYRGKVEAKNKGAIDMYYVKKAASFATA